MLCLCNLLGHDRHYKEYTQIGFMNIFTYSTKTIFFRVSNCHVFVQVCNGYT